MGISIDRLREAVRYDPETGAFLRLLKLSPRHEIGDRADVETRSGPMAGYKRISLDYKRHLAHRCAWALVHGEWPEATIDHINGDKADNRIANLRCVSDAVNHQNLREPKRNNRSGFLGVVAHQGRWRASVTLNRKTHRVGMFDTPEEAHQAYLAAKRRLHQGCTI